jgi:hypothetical protein
VRSVSDSVRQTTATVSSDVRRKSALIARWTVHHCASLQLESQPKGATHWSSRRIARQTGLSVSTVQRIWRAFGLKPHRQETFKLSTNPDFVAKVRDVVGLYLSPPDHALVLSVDEKSQIQALDRSQKVYPIRPGQAPHVA